MSLRHFLTRLDFDKYQTLGFFYVSSLGTCLVYWLCILRTLPHMCISHVLLMHCTQPPLAHTFATLVQYIISISLACHACFMLCSFLFLRCFVFCLSFISYTSCASYASLSLFMSSFLSLLLGPFFYS